MDRKTEQRVMRKRGAERQGEGEGGQGSGRSMEKDKEAEGDGRGCMEAQLVHHVLTY